MNLDGNLARLAGAPVPDLSAIDGEVIAAEVPGEIEGVTLIDGEEATVSEVRPKHADFPAVERAALPQFPGVPPLNQSAKGFESQAWFGLFGPAGMPPDIVRRLNETQVAVLKAPELAEKLAGEAVEPWPMTPEQFGQYIKADVARWTALAKARNIRLDE